VLSLITETDQEVFIRPRHRAPVGSGVCTCVSLAPHMTCFLPIASLVRYTAVDGLKESCQGTEAEMKAMLSHFISAFLK
jgi:hypothetical protein